MTIDPTDTHSRSITDPADEGRGAADDVRPDTDAPGADAPTTEDGWRRWMPRRRASGGPDEKTPEAPDAPDGAPTADGGAPAEPLEQETGTIQAAVPPAEGSAPRRRWGRRRAMPETPETAATADDGSAATDAGTGDATADGAAPEPITAADTAGGVGRLRRRRRKLLRERESAVYHLGGLAFELHRRDMLGEDVLRRRAGEIAELDAGVHDIDMRLDRMAAERRTRRAARSADPRTPVGHCLTCRAPFQVDARFCWQCGSRLAPAVPDVADAQTGVISKETA